MKKLFFVFIISFAFLQTISAQKPPPVYLNHLYLVLDEQTYRDVTDSGFMRGEFANFEERTTVSQDGKSWTGAYFYGEQTYIEFFLAGRDPQFKSNESGLGFGVEQAGAAEIYYNRLKERFGAQAEKGLITQKINDRDIAWFHDAYVNYKDDKQTFFDWLMEYEKDFLKKFYPDLKPAEDGITRRQNLARSYKAERLFKNVREVTIALDETERNRLVKELEAFDYKIEQKKNETVADGQDIRFFIVPNATANGIIKVKIDLTRKKQGQKTYRFGAKSILKFENKTAVWLF
jgi:hypothetical protein